MIEYLLNSKEGDKLFNQFILVGWSLIGLLVVVTSLIIIWRG